MTHALTVSNGEAMKSAIAMQTFGEPMDVAWALAFLASDYARYITGTTLEISGGKMGVQNPAKAWKDKEARA
ncbi:MAG: SDR family oxidoreductase [Vescimonas sp.]